MTGNPEKDNCHKQSKHTPGPWVWEGRTIEHFVNGDCDFMAVIVGAGLGDEPDYDTIKANARLISAAPDLLAALKEVLACWNSDRRIFIKTYKNVVDAIEKAERGKEA